MGRTRQRGGRYVGRGISGIVYSPVLACEDGSEAPFRGPGYVGKAIPETSLREQLDIPNIAQLREFSDSIILPRHYCLLSEQQSNENFSRNTRNVVYENSSSHSGKKKYYTYQVIYPNGGDAVLHLLTSDRSNHARIFNAIKTFMPILLRFNTKFIHSDLHLNNLVFDGARIRMIDFETLQPVTKDTEKDDLRILLFSIYRFIELYSKDNPEDITYRDWLVTNAKYKTPDAFESNSIKDIVSAINTIPTVDADAVAINVGLPEENEMPKSKCGRKGRCTIMGGGGKRKSRRSVVKSRRSVVKSRRLSRR